MKRLSSSLVLVLAGCTSTGTITTKPAQIDPVATIRATCAVLPAAHAVFLKTVSDADKRQTEAQVMAGLQPICENPEAVTNPVTAIAVLAEGIQNILALND